MKNPFYRQWLADSRPKVFVRFWRNHLHRGLDRRGVSTLGNFIAELAAVEHLAVFNVAAFAAGGKTALAGALEDADERGDDPALAYLASIARSANTVFDLRPVREVLHRIPPLRRTSTEASLVYWADSYDALPVAKLRPSGLETLCRVSSAACAPYDID